MSGGIVYAEQVYDSIGNVDFLCLNKCFIYSVIFTV